MNWHRISAAAIAASLTFGAGAQSPALDIAQVPLFLVTPVKPALIMAVDDSGSMDAEILVDSNDGAIWWNRNIESFSGLGTDASGTQNVAEPGRLNFNASGANNSTWRKYFYLFPNGTGTDGRTLSDGGSHFAVPPLPQYAFARSPEYNAIYFNPAVDYPPFPSEGSATFADVDPRAAQADPVRGTQTFDLTAPVRWDQANRTFRFQRNMELPPGVRVKQAQNNSCINNPDWTTVSTPFVIPNQSCDIAVEYFPATFWLSAANSPPAAFGFTGSPIAGGVAPDGSPMLGYEIKPENFATSAKYQQAIQQFANWFQYYRKRVHLTRSAMGQSFSDVDFLRVGFHTINNRVNVTMRDMAIQADRTNFFDWQYDLRGSGGTPNRQAVQHLGNQFTRTGSDAPIIESCQRNFGMLVTDGFSNAATLSVGNVDGELPPPLGDNVPNTMADLVYSFYRGNLRPDLEAGKVPTPTACNQANPPLRLDCNPDPHMNFFSVTLGAKGLLFGRDEDLMADPYSASSIPWPTSFPIRHPSSVDDIWHATLNSRGAMFTATRPDELVDALRAVLREISTRILPVGFSATSTRLDANVNIFQGSLDSTRWSGDLVAINARTRNQVWSAEQQLPGPGARNIRTWSGAGSVPFNTSMAPAIKERIFGAGFDAAQANQVIEYLRGNRVAEQQNGGNLRDRDSVLGDIVNSRPVLSGPGNEGWGRLPGIGEAYRAYVDGAKATRTPVVIVGANDGMLHVFNANSGRELFAYIPGAVHGKLAALADPDYSHEFFVDGQITVQDAYINGGWRTVALATLGAGGRGVVALDITDPGAIQALWELNSEQDDELGHPFGQPAISRLGSGTWVAVLGNGYNSNGNQPRLLVRRLDNGAPVDSVPLGTSGNGLSGVSVMLDPLTQTSLFRAYGADLDGNLWRVDFGDGGASGSNRVFSDPQGRPVTTTPTISVHPAGGVLVMYGSGKLIEASDRLQANPPTERFWVVRDQGGTINGTGGFGRAQVVGSGAETRVEVVDEGENGWFLNLPARGERVITRARVSFGRLVFASFQPLEDPCSAGGVNRIYVLDALTGRGALPSCEYCGVLELGEGAPIEPAIFIDPTEPVEDEEPDPPDAVPDEPLEVPDPGESVDAWCSKQTVLNPETGEFIVIGSICDGRQIWRQAK